MKNCTKIFSIVVALYIACSITIVCSVSAVNPENGTYPTQENTNNENTIHIYTTDDLINVANIVNNGNGLNGYKIYLMNNLNFKYEEFTAIGNASNAFNGSFFGNNHQIDYISLYSIDDSCVGLFGNIGSHGVVKNVIVGGHSTFTGHDRVGGIAGVNQGSIVKCCSRANLNSKGTLIGGLVGLNTTHSSVCECTLSKHARILCDNKLCSPFSRITGINLGTIDKCEIISKFNHLEHP